jgi:tyrosine decarboxylase/aspartate 1-decarboxylase
VSVICQESLCTPKKRYFSSNDLHLGEISLECSRAGASAVALWTTQRLYPLVKGGEFAGGLAASRQAALNFFEKLNADKRFIAPVKPELDIVVYAVRSGTASQSSKLAQAIFDQAAKNNLHLALASLPAEIIGGAWPDLVWDQPTVTCLRSVLMKADHLANLEKIWAILSSATDRALAGSVVCK